jgi:hypothetical protein
VTILPWGEKRDSLFANPHLRDQLRNWNAHLQLLQHGHNLLYGKSLPLHSAPLYLEILPKTNPQPVLTFGEPITHHCSNPDTRAPQFMRFDESVELGRLTYKLIVFDQRAAEAWFQTALKTAETAVVEVEPHNLSVASTLPLVR